MGGKRVAAAGGAGGAAAKKQKSDPVAAKCAEVVAALKALHDMPAAVREMLAVALPLAMVPEAERHGLQESMITAVAEQMAKVEAGLKTTSEQAEAHVSAMAKEKEHFTAAVAAADAALSEKRAVAKEKQKALAQDARDVRAAKAALAEAEGKKAALEVDVGAAERDRSELRAAVADVFQPLKDGTAEQDTESKAAALVTKLQRLVHMEESLFTVAPAALGKAPAARGQFELMVVNEISQQCAKRLAALDDQVEQAAPARAANADAAARARAQLTEARGRQRASAEAFTAARTEQEQSEARHLAAVKDKREAGPRLTRAEKALQDAAGRLEGFLAGPAVSFAELRTRTAAAEEEPPPEAAPVPASCAGEVAAAAGAAAAGAAEVAAVACA